MCVNDTCFVCVNDTCVNDTCVEVLCVQPVPSKHCPVHRYNKGLLGRNVFCFFTLVFTGQIFNIFCFCVFFMVACVLCVCIVCQAGTRISEQG